METTVKKSNKENKPEAELKKARPRNVVSKQKPMKPTPLQSKNHPREEQLGSKIKTHSELQKRKTLSQAFRTEQTIRHLKLVKETQKPPASVPPKPAPGTYKGRVIQSKIDCFRKLASKDEKPAGANPKPPARSQSLTVMPGSSRARLPPHLAGRVKSVPDVQKAVPQKQAQTKTSARPATVPARPMTSKPSSTLTRPAPVPARPATVPTRPATSKPSSTLTRPATVPTGPATSAKLSTALTRPATFARPGAAPAKPTKKPLTMSATVSTKHTAFIKKKEPSMDLLKPGAAAASQQKPSRSISSSVSQYRVRTESAEERRAKLASWLASKGKQVKRPATVEKAAAAPQTCKPQPSVEEEAQPAPLKQSEIPELSQRELPESKPAFSSSPNHIVNTTLDLLDNSDLDLPVDPEIRLETLVLNLCDRLEALETPSSCESRPKATAGGGDEDEAAGDEEEEEEELEMKINSVTAQEEEEKLLKDEEEEEDDEETKLWNVEEEKLDSTLDVTEACVVKYSVKTTPFLQSVKKKMDGEMKAPGTPVSRHKSGIKELKFLTPVRRSSRIHRNSSRLPEMLNEQDPCVSSLAELELLDDADSNAYIYRRNPALLQHLPEQAHKPPPEPKNPLTHTESSASAP